MKNVKNNNLKYIITIVAIILLFGLFIFLNNSNTLNSINNISNNKSNSNTTNNSNVQNNNNSISNLNNDQKSDSPKETELSSYSTEIKDNSPGRLTNIRITCDTINGYILEPDQVFSFNDIVGQPSSDKGYEEATVIVDGEHETGIGGRKLSSK